MAENEGHSLAFELAEESAAASSRNSEGRSPPVISPAQDEEGQWWTPQTSRQGATSRTSKKYRVVTSNNEGLMTPTASSPGEEERWTTPGTSRKPASWMENSSAHTRDFGTSPTAPESPSSSKNRTSSSSRRKSSCKNCGHARSPPAPPSPITEEIEEAHCCIIPRNRENLGIFEEDEEGIPWKKIISESQYLRAVTWVVFGTLTTVFLYKRIHECHLDVDSSIISVLRRLLTVWTRSIDPYGHNNGTGTAEPEAATEPSYTADGHMLLVQMFG